MEHSNAEGSGTFFKEIKQHANAMDEIYKANYGDGLEVVPTSNLHANGDMDRAMPHSDQDDSHYIENILAPFEETHEFFEDLECRFTVSAMVADAVTNGMVRAVLEESSEVLAAKEAEILALNDKLEEKDAKLWELEETLQFKQEELVVRITESKSEFDRLVLDFMHEKERMQRRLHETETVLLEKERELATKNERMLAMATELEVERKKTMIMEERIQNMQNVKASSEEKTSALIGDLEQAKTGQESVYSSIREEVLQNESELMERSQQVENVERVVPERNEPVGFLERSISFMEKRNYELLQDVWELEPQKREETEEQMVRQETERCLRDNVYKGSMPELALVRDTIEIDRLHSGIDISNFQQQIGHPKNDSEAELVEKKREVSDLAEELEQSILCNELQVSIIAGILQTFIQESEHQISQLKQDLDSKDKQISSLTCTVSSQRLDCERIQAQISSSHVMDADIESNLSTLKAEMETQCSKLQQDIGGERMNISAGLSRVTKFQLMNNGLAERLREQKLNLEQVEEKLAEQQWQQEIELEFVNQVFACKLGEAMQLIALLYSILEEKKIKLGSHLNTTFALETPLNVVGLEMPRLQEIVKSSESLDYNLSSIHLHKIDAEFDKLHAKFLQLAFQLDSFENTSQASFHQIQSWVASFQEKLLEQQWKQSFEDEIIALMLSKFLNDLEGQFETKEHKELTQLSTVQARWDEGRLALMNEISNLRQELELLKIEEPVKSSFISDVGSSNGFQVLSRLTQEAKNEEATDSQRKERAARRLSAGQFSTGMSRMENSHVTSTTGKIAGHSIRESDLLEHNPTETLDIQESPLKSMTKEQLMIHFKRVEAELKREIEFIMDEKTEEIYRLKRDFLREKDSFHSRKDREFEALKKRIAEVIRILNKFDEENSRLSASLRLEVQSYEMVCKLKDELQAENRRLHNILRQKENELEALSDKLSDALRKDAEFSSTETCLLKQISELQSEKEAIDLQKRNEIQMLRTAFEEMVKEKEIILISVLKEQEEIMKEKLLLEDMIREKDTALKLSVMEREEHEQKLALMEKLIEEKEKASGLVLREVEDVEQIEKRDDSLDLALKECEDLKKQKAHLETILQIKDSTIDSVAREQEELKKHITLLREGMEERDDRLKMAVEHLEQVMEEKKTLERIIEEKKNALCLNMQKEEEQRKQLEAIIAEQENALTLGRRNIEEHDKVIVSLEETLKLKQSSLERAMRGKEEEEQQRNLLYLEVQKLKDAIKNMRSDMETVQKQNKMILERCVRNSMDAALELECRVTQSIQDKILRLEGVKQQLKKLYEQINLVALRESYYKGNLGKKYCNLQKAEVEVDLLGDEVENLLSLLEKVYVALDHYLPVLQHYPGIPELLKLIRRELIAQMDTGLEL